MTDTRNWSSEQVAIFNEFETGQGNFVVIAFAGTGKTTTAVEGIRRAPEASILFTAFNSKNAAEMSLKLKALTSGRAVSKTVHSTGCAFVMKNWEGLEIDMEGKCPTCRLNNTTRERSITDAVCGAIVPDQIKRLITKLHSKAREVAPHARVAGELVDLAVAFECDPDEQWAQDGYDLAYVERMALACMERAATVKPACIDGPDMIFLPLRNNWLRQRWDAVVIDEYQDLTPAMLEMLVKVSRGRVIMLGDPHQAIYAFRGADTASAEQLIESLGAKRLPLTTTYRCGRAIVDVAAQLVPGFTAADSNPDGRIEHTSYEKLTAMASASDFILSRLNAPLVSIAMKLLRSGKRTRIAGRDIGKGLIGLVRKLRARSVPDFLSKVVAHADRESARLRKQYASRLTSEAFVKRLEGINDQAEMLTSLADGARNVDEIVERISSLFTDDGLGDKGLIVCSSVHKAKGLEAGRVFVLADTLKDHDQEELNIRYVAITRAINELVWVS